MHLYMDVTTWYLEQTSRSDLLPARPPEVEVDIVRAEVVSPEFSRFLNTAVGGDWHWTNRLPWTWQQWADWLDRGVETWVAYHRGTPAGYAELLPGDDAAVEIASFGLLSWAVGKGWAATSSRPVRPAPGISPSGSRTGSPPGGCGCTPAPSTARSRSPTTGHGGSGSTTAGSTRPATNTRAPPQAHGREPAPVTTGRPISRPRTAGGPELSGGVSMVSIRGAASDHGDRG